MKLQVYRTNRRGDLFPIGIPKSIEQVEYLYYLHICFEDQSRIQGGEIIRKYDPAANVLYLQGATSPCSPSMTIAEESSTAATSTH